VTTRTLQQIIPGMETSDGAGVKLRRSIGASPALRLDPFLMLDEFGTENPDDYIAGFPPHPHRGFETVTYMLDGHMRHQDHLGNVGELKSGGVQWMTAARGIIHSEMPQQDSGRMRGFQLWLNLPGNEKMNPASYRDIPAAEIPTVALPGGGSVKVIAGTITLGEQRIAGPVNPDHTMATDPLYLDVHLPPNAQLRQPIPEPYNAFLYVYEGSAAVHDAQGARELKTHAAGVLSRSGDVATVSGGAGGARLILLAARPLNEPVVQYGPFVMNTREEIEQALADYRDGKLAA
jgi:redox-sensitive bicupin YhaK (pirin superfamily)